MADDAPKQPASGTGAEAQPDPAAALPQAGRWALVTRFHSWLKVKHPRLAVILLWLLVIGSVLLPLLTADAVGNSVDLPQLAQSVGRFLTHGRVASLEAAVQIVAILALLVAWVAWLRSRARRQDSEQEFVKHKQETEGKLEQDQVGELLDLVTALSEGLDDQRKAELASQALGLARDFLTRRRVLDSGSHALQNGPNAPRGTENMPDSHGAAGPSTERTDGPATSEPPDPNSAAN